MLHARRYQRIIRVSMNLSVRMILRTVGMLYRYLAVLHRQFPLLRTTIDTLLLSLLSLTSSGSLFNPFSHDDGLSRCRGHNGYVLPLQAVRSFVRSFACPVFVQTRVWYHYPIVRPHAWSTAQNSRTLMQIIEKVATKITLFFPFHLLSPIVHSICHISNFSTCF